MENSFQRQGADDTQKKRDFRIGLQIFESILTFMRHSVKWLIGLDKLTEKEQEDAGIYLGRLGNE
jgi:hypothetical protein